MTTNTGTASSTQYASGSLGSRAELMLEASLGDNKIVVLKYGGSKSLPEAYVTEITKDDSTQLLLSPGNVAYFWSPNKLTLEHYGVRESGVSGFIKSQVTGESFVMTEAKGSGKIRMTPNSSLLGVHHYQNAKLCIPNVNLAYIRAILGSCEVSNPQKTKSAIPLIYSEVRLQNALVLLECEAFYEISITPGNSIEIESREIIFWSGDLVLDENKASNASGDSSLLRFSGIGKVYLSLSM